LDFAITSGMRTDLASQAAAVPEIVFHNYEHTKREYKQTNRLCSEAGFIFIPMVVEAHAGGWSKTARAVLDWIAAQAAAAQHGDPSTVSLKIAQRISCVLHRENARAILRRAPAAVLSGRAPPSGWDSLDTTWQ
jgi:hypothetical protein